MSALGFIGLGVMGQPMALNLHKAGHALSVYARNPAQSALLLATGAAVLATPTAVARAADVLFINVSDDAALDAVLFGGVDATAGAASGLPAADQSPSVQIPVRLAGREYELHFVSTHWFDLKTVLSNQESAP